MADHRAPRPETQAAQALGWIEPGTRAIVPSIVPATTFERERDLGYAGGVSYARHGEAPATRQAEAVLAALEGGGRAILYGSGMAAVAAVFQTLRVGDHVVAQQPLYYGVGRWLRTQGAAMGLTADFVPAGDLDAFEGAIRPGETRVVWIETPANPTWSITDIAAVARLAHESDALLAVDSTVATPVFTRPIELGADIVMHSATKYLNGHSDVLAGALIVKEGRKDVAERLVGARNDNGAVLGAFEAWLLLRGMRTLFPRVHHAARGAQALAERLSRIGAVTHVLYPGLPSHPGHDVAARQMAGGFGGMLSIRVRGGRPAAIGVAGRLEVFKRATSLGGVESLVEHRASIEPPGSGTPDDLLRLSVGLEHVDDLAADLEQALKNV
ncbi:MAG: PLP-dependent aspartate aminotransferase family protein [Alphaproteobacteria bacterium]